MNASTRAPSKGPMRDRRAPARLAALLAALTIPAFVAAPVSALERGARAPEIGLRDLAGNNVQMSGLRGKVVLVDFWTYTCINCIRTFPYLKAWDDRYRDQGLVIVGVHTPEFAFEKSAENVQAAINQNKIRYPVVQDNDFKTWDAYGNQYWPAKYLIDMRGRVRYTHFGEGKYDVTEEAIRKLLAEGGERQFGEEAAGNIEAETQSDFRITRETYLGSGRAAGFDGKPCHAQVGQLDRAGIGFGELFVGRLGAVFVPRGEFGVAQHHSRTFGPRGGQSCIFLIDRFQRGEGAFCVAARQLRGCRGEVAGGLHAQLFHVGQRHFDGGFAHF